MNEKSSLLDLPYQPEELKRLHMFSAHYVVVAFGMKGKCLDRVHPSQLPPATLSIVTCLRSRISMQNPKSMFNSRLSIIDCSVQFNAFAIRSLQIWPTNHYWCSLMPLMTNLFRSSDWSIDGSCLQAPTEARRCQGELLTWFLPFHRTTLNNLSMPIP